MTYQATLDYLFTAAPMFQNVGASAYKEGLSTTHLLDAHFGHPHRNYHTLHVAGTNGKGSTSHTLAAVLQTAGYRVGLYTSPHLTDFRERIRVNGVPIDEQRVIDFVAQERTFFESLSPSFFELTTALAFLYFAEQKVDVAIIEVGLGGRLDCTNIITPLLSIITNISLDHTQFLGNSLAQIAQEKGGIIKPQVPVVVGQALEETRPVFESIATRQNSPLHWAEESKDLLKAHPHPQGGWLIKSSTYGPLHFALGGACQCQNAATILTALRLLAPHFKLTSSDVSEGFAQVCQKTGLQGRWQVISQAPFVVCDTGHNLDAWQWIAPQLNRLKCRELHLIFGASADKDISQILALLPAKAKIYLTQASVHRALPLDLLQRQAEKIGIVAQSFPTVSEAYSAARATAQSDDAIFVGGSSFVVADFLNIFPLAHT